MSCKGSGVQIPSAPPPGLRRSVVMSGSSLAAPERDAEGGQGSAWVAGVAAQRGGDVDRPCPAQHPDDQVAQRRHDVRAAAGADLGGILGEGGVAQVVQAVLDLSSRLRLWDVTVEASAKRGWTRVVRPRAP